MADSNTFVAATLETLGTTGAAVTPSDSADLPKLGAFIVTAWSGLITVTPSLQSTSIQIYANAGQPLPFFVDRVWETGTSTLTGIVAGYNR